MLVKNRNFGQKSEFCQNSKCWSKIKIEIENFYQNFDFYPKFWVLTKFRFWATYRLLTKISIFGQKSNFWSTIKTKVFTKWWKIKILVKTLKFWSKIKTLKNQNCTQKSKLKSKIEILKKLKKSKWWSNFQKSKFFSKIKIFFKNQNVFQKSKFWSKINFFQKSKCWSKIKDSILPIFVSKLFGKSKVNNSYGCWISRIISIQNVWWF